jgi:hypothetical protein
MFPDVVDDGRLSSVITLSQLLALPWIVVSLSSSSRLTLQLVVAASSTVVSATELWSAAFDEAIDPSGVVVVFTFSHKTRKISKFI